ncbi:TetR/AcrR family transcriptional regulator [Streptomyces sp. NPDC048172]|uniref:TetR/AcrR family transcriptional regulator n=1 Tax=Streptomyces sp. NPDC048172 TaxID=3365505 RepID=UPI0037198B93
MGRTRTLHAVDDDADAGSTRGRRDLEARERILAATLALLQERGYARLTIEGVATEASVGKATVYRSWPNKAALVLAAVQDRLTDVPTEPTGDTRAELLAVAEQAMARFYGSGEVRLVLPALIAEAAREPALLERLRTEVLEPRNAQARAVVERAVARGALPEDTDVAMVLEQWAGYMLFRGLWHDDPLPEGTVERLVDATLASPPRSAVWQAR